MPWGKTEIEQCLKWRKRPGVVGLDVCREPKGHEKRNPEHWDPETRQRWTDQGGEVALPTFDEMRGLAHRGLGDVLDGMRSDWQPDTGPTHEQAEAFAEARQLITQARDALDRTTR